MCECVGEKIINVTFAAVLVFAFYLGCTDDSVGMETLAISDEKETFFAL